MLHVKLYNDVMWDCGCICVVYYCLQQSIANAFLLQHILHTLHINLDFYA